ncbi:MAG: aminoglycoside phosphotransferase [Solirubrobacterales bacterium]|nr:aminoglycoside phosphotransferase [Solirubrobacterales bacterium]
MDAGLARWLAAELGDPGPFREQVLTGGNSNETLLVESERSRWIVRRPPQATIDPRAHSMRREHLVLSALAQTDVPAPRPLAFCSDQQLAPGGLLVMECVEGLSLTGAAPASYPPGAAGARAIGEAAIDALAALHSVPWREVGLEGFGSPDGFLERQVGRWRDQYERYAIRELELFEPVARWLQEQRPRDFTPGLLHGDFHIDNCLMASEPPVRVMAIIDFEMSTIGDPLLDLGLLLGFWGDRRPQAPAMPRLQGVSRIAGAPPRAELAERYAAACGRSVERLDFYMTLAFWKLAAIVEGAYAHHVKGNLDNDYSRALERDVPALLREAAGFAGIA